MMRVRIMMSVTVHCEGGLGLTKHHQMDDVKTSLLNMNSISIREHRLIFTVLCRHPDMRI